MSSYRQVMLGLLTALLSLVFILGSIALSMVEDSRALAFVTGLPGLTPTEEISPATLPGPLPTDSPQPGPSPTLTDTPTLAPSPVQSPTPTLTPVSTGAACTPPPGWMPITVQTGDTLESLALIYSATASALAQANCLSEDTLTPGSVLYAPAPAPTVAPTRCYAPRGWVHYTVQQGDTLYHISQLFGITVYQLQKANCLSSTVIKPGQKLYVPNVPTRTSPPTETETAPPTSTPTPSPVPTDTPSPTPLPTHTPTVTSTATAPPIPTGTFTTTPTSINKPTPLPSETPTPGDGS